MQLRWWGEARELPDGWDLLLCLHDNLEASRGHRGELLFGGLTTCRERLAHGYVANDGFERGVHFSGDQDSAWCQTASTSRT